MRLIIISNRAPIKIVKDSEGHYLFEESSGGLASGLRTYVERAREKHKKIEIVWIGWPGASVDTYDQATVRAEILNRFEVLPVFLSDETMNKFYEGFCNKTIWPLFHYFPNYTIYNKEFWIEYVAVNKTFCDEALKIIKPSDTIWVHDYQLMLLPAMLRAHVAQAAIGFFLHIPFPSYEIFRLLPSEWRREILQGLLGADLIGFHTHDYRTHFLNSVLRILGNEDHMGELSFRSRQVKADTFPMGIDYEKFHSAASSEPVLEEKENLQSLLPPEKYILSLDRQDYSKGIMNRLEGYELFLENNPDWRGRVCLIMIVIPSRTGVENYQDIKSRIDELVGKINGTFGSLEWTPILYQYREIPFHELIALYSLSDAALVTPLRDGMNLVAKEFIAAKTPMLRRDGGSAGVLILSEMAGAVDELDEAIVINPNNKEEIAAALYDALSMEESEQIRRIEIMQKRIGSYDVLKWADDFLSSLAEVKKEQSRLAAKTLELPARKKIIEEFRSSASRLLVLDYDGTLTPIVRTPSEANPSVELLDLLSKLTHIPKTTIVIMSGRDKKTIDSWLGETGADLAAEHGLFLKTKGEKWGLLKPVKKMWKKKILPIMNHYAEKLPGSMIEEKEYSLVFHYRRSLPGFARLRVNELTNHLVSLIGNMDLQIMHGKKILEVRNSGIDKGIAAMHWLAQVNIYPCFILAAGDDTTDEDLFKVMPQSAYSIKVGKAPTNAMYNVNSQGEMIELLKELSEFQFSRPSE